ncbi:MAG: serine/threonine-protein kinase [Halioglobus sp.]
MEEPSIDGYTIEGKLGSGGMSTVFLAEQTKFKRKVALKIMSGHLSANPDFRARFIREAQIVASLTHPGIVPVHDLGTTETSSFMAMEYLPGPDFKARLKSGMNIADGLRVLRLVSDALGYAHSKQVIHRDIKPANILFREDGSPVLVDFGIARNMETSTQLTVAGTVMGTPHYMSPEQCSGEPIDFRADLYSLGIMLFEVIAGRLPYDADNSAAMSFKHVQAPIPKLNEEQARYQNTVERALAKRPSERFQSAREFSSAISELEQHLPDTEKLTDVVPATPPTVRGKFQRVAPKSDEGTEKSRTVLFGGLAAILFTLSIGVYFIVKQPAASPILGASKEAIGKTNNDADQSGIAGAGLSADSEETTNPIPAETANATRTEPAGDQPTTSTLSAATKDLLVRAKLDVWNGKMLNPKGDNAYEKLEQILVDEPSLTEALELQERILNTVAQNVELQIENEDWSAAQSGIESLESVGADNRVNRLQEKLASAQMP